MRRVAQFVGGLGAGAAGSVALLASDRLSRAVLGRRPLFAPSRVARRLAWIRLHRWLPPRRARWAGAVLRAGYGPLLGAALAPVWLSRTRSTLVAGTGIGASVLAFEWLALPAAGATPKLGRWSAMERGLLALHTLWFGWATAVAAAVGGGRNVPHPRRPMG